MARVYPKRKVRLQTVVSAEIADRVESFAKNVGLSVSAFIGWLVEENCGSDDQIVEIVDAMNEWRANAAGRLAGKKTRKER